jgi:hypothetical protein
MKFATVQACLWWCGYIHCLLHTSSFGQATSWSPTLRRRTVNLFENYQQALVDIDLEPFQILYLTNDGSTESPNNMTEMELVQGTRAHVMQFFATDDEFETLSLYHTVRSDREALFWNGTKVAFRGTAVYRTIGNGTEDATALASRFRDAKFMQQQEYLCFMEKNASMYVERLRNSGWTSLRAIMVMSSRGNMVEYVDGKMVESVSGGSSGEDTLSPLSGGGEPMDESMSMTMYIVAITVPISVVVLMCAFCTLYRLRYHVNWRSTAAPKQAWQSDQRLGAHASKNSLQHSIEDGSETLSCREKDDGY